MDVTRLGVNRSSDDRVDIFDDWSATCFAEVDSLSGQGAIGSILQFGEQFVDIDLGRAVVFVEQRLNLIGGGDDLGDFHSRSEAQIFQGLAGKGVDQGHR